MPVKKETQNEDRSESVKTLCGKILEDIPEEKTKDFKVEQPIDLSKKVEVLQDKQKNMLTRVQSLKQKMAMDLKVNFLLTCF